MSNWSRYTAFKVLFWVTQLIGGTAMLLLSAWVFSYRGGLAWHSNPKVQFNWHALLMPLAMVYLCANELMTFRALRYGAKRSLKFVHSGFSVVIIVMVIIGYWAILDCHNYQGKPNWFSLHSWLGIITTILYLSQVSFGNSLELSRTAAYGGILLPASGVTIWHSFTENGDAPLKVILGCTSFLWPRAAIEVRRIYKPFHVFVGLTTFVMASATSLLGMFEEMKNIPGYKQLSGEGVMMNFCGVLFTWFTILVVFIQTWPNFKRQPLSTDN